MEAGLAAAGRQHAASPQWVGQGSLLLTSLLGFLILLLHPLFVVGIAFDDHNYTVRGFVARLVAVLP